MNKWPGLLILLAPALAFAQEPEVCQYKDWIGRASEVEEALKNTEIVSVEDVGMGVTKPSRVISEATTPRSRAPTRTSSPVATAATGRATRPRSPPTSSTSS